MPSGTTGLTKRSLSLLRFSLTDLYKEPSLSEPLSDSSAQAGLASYLKSRKSELIGLRQNVSCALTFAFSSLKRAQQAKSGGAG